MTTETPPRRRQPRAVNPETANPPQRLTREFSTYDASTITDLLSILMANIEDGLLQSGATPGVDYTFRDLATWAMPMVYTGWKKNNLKWMAPPEDRPIDD
ncbi:hypothetical protein [Candidatus Oscillochloris fontis]|uniref:hypothetical protein n=1 Tax=Candidatus Oscillochloris fontis TaxID=2496868 RepID=UPI00101D0853|nr:hypothetical protein [Candidatus Oscillochloris fontis]